MPAEKPSFEFLMPAEEVRTLKKLVGRRWDRFWVAGGVIDWKWSRGVPSVYTVPVLVVEAGETFVIWADSLDLPDRTEEFRMVVSQPSMDIFRDSKPPRAPLRDFPADLSITDFLNRKNSVQLARRSYTRAPDHSMPGAEIVFDWGLLFANDLGSLLIFLDEHINLNLCVTTNDEVIAELLNKKNADLIAV